MWCQESDSSHHILSILKEFWEELKSDFLIFLFEFHENGKLAKGIIDQYH
jgi:hypothetical protein